MRVEVSCEKSEPFIFTLEDKETLVGSSLESRIRIDRNSGVSRKHVKITVEGENCFVTDLGSSNGTFINDEKLVPGKPYLFTSYFPIKLANSCFIALLGEDKAKIPDKGPHLKKAATSTQSETQAILSNTSTDRKPPKKPKASTRSRKDDNSRNKRLFMAMTFGILMIGAYQYNQQRNEKVERKRVFEENQRLEAEAKLKLEKERQLGTPGQILQKSHRITDEDFLHDEVLRVYQKDFTCIGELSKKICEILDIGTQNTGVYESVGTLVIFIPIEKFVSEAALLTPEAIYDHKSRKLLASLQLIEKLSDIDWSSIEKDVYIVPLRKKVNGSFTFDSVIGIRSSGIAFLKKETEDALDKFKENGRPYLNKNSPFFRIDLK